jgi:hypothetical protein
MAIAAQEQTTPEAPQPARPARRRAVTWSKPSQLRQSAPILRLLAEIWSISQVSKIGLLVDRSDVHLWVVMPKEDLEAEGRVYDAEYDYLHTTANPSFDLDLLILERMPGGEMPPFETVLER